MKKKLMLVFVTILLIALFVANYAFIDQPKIKETPDFFFGIDVAYADQEAIKNITAIINRAIHNLDARVLALSCNSPSLFIDNQIAP